MTTMFDMKALYNSESEQTSYLIDLIDRFLMVGCNTDSFWLEDSLLIAFLPASHQR